MKLLVALAVLALATIISAQNVTVGIANVRGTTNDPNIYGNVTFTTSGANVTISISVYGITQNLGVMHGVHIHQFGDLSSGDGESVGSHWNAYNMTHGCPEYNGTVRHIGDTGNWMVNADGSLTGTKTLDLIGLTGGVNSVIGFAVVIHNVTDNCVATTSSGARLAWGVIGVANPDYYSGTQNLAYPVNALTGLTGTTQAICVLRPLSTQITGASPVTGVVYFTLAADGNSVYVSATINGLADQKPRGFHIHQWGDLSLADGTSAGSHFTGYYYDSTSLHGIPVYGQPRTHHVGDMGNQFVFAPNGTGLFYGQFNAFGLYGNMNNIIGRAVIVHNNTDTCVQPTGNSGSRIAGCIIGPANPSYGGSLTQLTTVNSNQDTSYCAMATSQGLMTTMQATTQSMTTQSMTSGLMPVATTNAASSIAVFALLIVAAMLF